jgi:aldehyde:ferredoxin oxidoreductase
MAAPNNRIPEWINATTGWDMTHAELLNVGERIANLRMAFEVREGGNPAKREVPGRLVGEPPLKEGPFKDFTLDWKTQEKEYLEACDWDLETTKPSRRKLEELGLKDVAEALHA